MPEPKAQLVDPQGPIDVPGISATGIITATGGFVGAVQGAATGLANTTSNLNVGVVSATNFVGDVTGTASSVTKGTNLSLGIVTASSFAGDVFGNAAGLSTTTAGLKLGIVSATSFAGNFTGIGSGITGTPNIQAGIMTATSFAGNFTGLASGITGTPNLMVGILTGTSFSGDGSNLTGIAATNWITNNVNANSSTTTVDLNLGNVIKFNQYRDTTVSFANTGTTNIVTFIRNQSESFTTGGVEFDGNGDFLSLASTSDFDFGTDDFTIELWAKVNGYSNTPYFFDFRDDGSVGGTTNRIVWYFNGDYGQSIFWKNGSAQITASDGVTLGKWNHYALVRNSSNTTMYINGITQGSVSDSTDYGSGGSPICIGQRQGSYAAQSFDGVLSNLRIVKGTAVYTSNFVPPFYELTNVTNTKLLCCQDTSSTTVGAVKPGTITASGDPTASSQTISIELLEKGTTITWPSSIKWDGGFDPILNKNVASNDAQQFNLLTRDEGVTWYGWTTYENEGGNYLFAWGDDEQGRLGLSEGYGFNKSSPVQVGSQSNWNKLYGIGSRASLEHGMMMAQKEPGTLYSWGDNEMGGLGHNDAYPVGRRSSPTQVPGTNWAQVSWGSPGSAAAIKSDGTLWTWGNNESGRLGINAGHDKHRSSPCQVGSDTTWRTTDYSVACGEKGTMAIKTDGTLWGMGAHQWIGAYPAQKSSPVQIPGTTWDKIAAGGLGSIMAIKTDGTLWTWGNDMSGNLAKNGDSNFSSPKQVPGTTWGKALCMSDHLAGSIKTDGTLWVWGINSQGVLGQNNTSVPSYSSPIQIPGTNWKQLTIASQYASFGAIKDDGTMWTWGANQRGSLGLSVTAPSPGSMSYSSPTQIPGTNWDQITGAYYGFTAIQDNS